MGRQATLQPSVLTQSPMAPSINGLLELFSRTPRSTAVVPSSTGREAACLWRADAIHRAKNLAQMAVSLAEISDHPARQWLQPEIAAQVRSLARAYDALAEDDDGSQQVPCDILLSEIATRLTDIFGRPRGVSVRLNVSSILIAPASRRVLILLCSELIINALKYAYPSSAGGVIDIDLLTAGSDIVLTVQDDGVGPGSCSTGEGSSLIDQLCAVAGAVITRITRPNGRGLQVNITMPTEARSLRLDK